MFRREGYQCPQTLYFIRQESGHKCPSRFLFAHSVDWLLDCLASWCWGYLAWSSYIIGQAISVSWLCWNSIDSSDCATRAPKAPSWVSQWLRILSWPLSSAKVLISHNIYYLHILVGIPLYFNNCTHVWWQNPAFLHPPNIYIPFTTSSYQYSKFSLTYLGFYVGERTVHVFLSLTQFT